MKSKLTQERLKEVLHYDPETGDFTWKVTNGGWIKAGEIAGSIHHSGYRVIMIDGKSYQAHRLSVLYMEGFMPELTVDHIWRDRADNRYKGLREASRQCQTRNCGIRKDNTSGVKGVFFDNIKGKFTSQITVNRKHKHLGYFDSLLDAAYTRYAAEQCLDWQDCDINSSAKQFIDKMEILSYWSAI
jgi:hypothetical protein